VFVTLICVATEHELKKLYASCDHLALLDRLEARLQANVRELRLECLQRADAPTESADNLSVI
jgi:hypothetical protein